MKQEMRQETAQVDEDSRQRGRYLDCLAGITSQLLTAPDPEQLLPHIIGWLQEATGVSRCYYFDCKQDEASIWRGTRRCEAVAPGIDRQADSHVLPEMEFARQGLQRWIDELSTGSEVAGKTEDLPKSERQLLESQHVCWILVLPVLVQDEWVGFIGFDVCEPDVEMGDREVALLRSAANAISAALNRVKVEADRREAHNLLAGILRSSTEYAILATDLDWRILHYNPVAEEVFGYTAAEATGQRMPELGLLEGEDDALFDEIEVCVRESGSWEAETDLRDPTGRDRTISFLVDGLRGENGELSGYIVFARDVTEHRERERRLVESQRMESVGLLAGGIAHDFNNILMGVLGYASLAKDVTDPKHRAYRMLNTIELSAERAAALTNELLAYARGGKFQSVPVNLNDHVTELLNILTTALPRDIRVELDFDPAAPHVLADPTQLQQVVMNLCLNAGEAIAKKTKDLEDESFVGMLRLRTGTRELHAADRGQLIIAEAPPSGEYAFLEVSDNGCGMDEETLGRIFEPFFTTKFTGRGLGLAAVDGIIRNHGGCLQATSEPGVGTTFLVLMPAAAETAERPVEEQLLPLGGPETILVVDDEAIVRQVALLTLTNLGYRVMLAQNGREGLDVYRDHRDEISLVLLDLTMPGMGTKTMLSEFFKLGTETPILITSGYDEGTVQEMPEIKRAAGFLQKPYAPDVLARAVRAVLDRAGVLPAETTGEDA